MKLNEMLESNYLKQADFPTPRIVAIESLEKKNMAAPGEIPEYKWTVKFAGLAKPMACNSTNLKRLFKYCGSDSDDWPGKKVMVYTDPDVEFKGEIVGGLRIRQAPSAGTAAPRDKTNDDDSSIPF